MTPVTANVLARGNTQGSSLRRYWFMLPWVEYAVSVGVLLPTGGEGLLVLDAVLVAAFVLVTAPSIILVCCAPGPIVPENSPYFVARQPVRFGAPHPNP